MLLRQIPSRLSKLAATMSYRTKRRPQQPRSLPSNRSALKKLKHYFIKGSKIKKDETSLSKTEQNSRRQVPPNQRLPNQDPNDNEAQDLNPPRGPRQIPQAVVVEARRGQDVVEDVSSFSKSSTTQSSSLTSSQSSRPSERSGPKPSGKRKPGGIPISAPRPTESLVHLASQYADVQNPKATYKATGRRPVPSANNKPPLYTQPIWKGPDRTISKPVKKVPKGRVQVIQGPAHQRSQKTVVRKAEPQTVRRTADNNRHMSNVTVFEDFMGKKSRSPIPDLPPVPKIPASLAHRLSQPFREEAPEYENPFNDAASEDISPTSLVISPSESHAQTWLKYDRSVSKPLNRQSTDAPLFPRRNKTRPDSNQVYKWTPCQSCRKQIHPSTAVSNNGTYFCQDCAAAALSAQFDAIREGADAEEVVAKEEAKNKSSSKKILYPYAASAYPVQKAAADSVATRKPLPSPSASNSSSSNSIKATTQTKAQSTPRTRRKDVPPEYLHIYSPPLTPQLSAPPSHPLTQTQTPPQPQQQQKQVQTPVSSYYSTPLPDGTYPRYRTPPPPPRKASKQRQPSPINIVPLPQTPAETPRLRPRQPASSIYPSTARLSRPPSLPSMPPPLPNEPVPAIPTSFVDAEKGEATGLERIRKNKRSDTLDTKCSDTSYRAAMEEEVIDAYANMYVEEGGDSPVSPLSEGGFRDGKWEGERGSVVSEYEAPGWRVRR
ncbi:MAG: hypothetical protein L6R41_004513 [Letrouitia leprolyta]|nr:MAG: hypothetical protein L6R41_004513 [Letrouitia leprolyta]